MARYSMSLLTKKLMEFDLDLIDFRTLQRLLGIKNDRTGYRVIDDLVKNEILTKIERDKYQVAGRGSTFKIANFLYQPSYISLETALNYWGVVSQFPFEVTSITSKKTSTKSFDGKVYGFRHIAPKYFGMFTKVDGALVALPEKALFDQIYLTSKGLKTINFDEYDMTKIKKTVFNDIVEQLSADKKIMELYFKIKK